MLQVCFDCYGTYTTDSVYQWDLNRRLAIRGLNYASAPAIHFSNKKSTEALVVQSTIEDGVIYCDVPNILLQEPYDIVGYVCECLDQELITYETIRIPIKARVKPADYAYNDNIEILTYYSLMSEITAVDTKLEKEAKPAIETNRADIERLAIMTGLYNKNVVFFGDSCTAGFISDSGSPVLTPEESYPYKFGKLTKCNMYNYAVGGATMSNKSSYASANGTFFSEQITNAQNEIGLTNIDYAFINFGINDHGQNAEIGTNKIVADTYLDESRFLDAFYMGVKRLLNSNPKMKIICIIPHYSTRELYELNTALNSLGLSLESYRDAIINYCGILNLPVVDFRKCGINRFNATIYHNGDPLHLTKFGYEVQAQYLVNNWRNILESNTESRSKVQRASYPLCGPNFFKVSKQEYTTNYINGVAFGLTKGQSVTSQESVFLQAGYYIISATMRGFVQNDVKLEIVDGDGETQYVNEANIVSFEEYSWYLHVTSNILSATVKITNESTSEGNLIVSNFDIRPCGDFSADKALIKYALCSSSQTLAQNYVSNVENYTLHLYAHITTKEQVKNTSIMTVEGYEFNRVFPIVNTTDNVITYISFRPNGSGGSDGHVANIEAGKDVFIMADIFLGDNTKAFNVIS